MKIGLIVLGVGLLAFAGWVVFKIIRWNKVDWDESIEDV